MENLASSGADATGTSSAESVERSGRRLGNTIEPALAKLAPVEAVHAQVKLVLGGDAQYDLHAKRRTEDGVVKVGILLAQERGRQLAVSALFALRAGLVTEQLGGMERMSMIEPHSQLGRALEPTSAVFELFLHSDVRFGG